MRWLATTLRDAVAGIGGLLDAIVPGPPEALVSACRSVQRAVTESPIAWLVPWVELAVGIGIVVAGVAVAYAVRTTRIGVSLATGGGGA